MGELRTVEIDIDIHKLIEAERRSFSEPPREVLRRLLKLPPSPRSAETPKKAGAHRSWSGEGVTLPHGTALRMRYNNRQHEGRVVDGKWIVDGKPFDSPSGAASGVAVTKKGRNTKLDGWIYWQVQMPGETMWTPIATLRPTQNSTTTRTAEELGL